MKKKSKNIELKDITSSPYFTIAIMVIVCALVIGVIVTLIMGINNTKKEILDARKLYEQNVREVAILEELKIQSEDAQKKLDECKDILPDKLGDVYELQEEVIDVCKTFGLDVTACTFTVAQNATPEIVFAISASGSYEKIHDYMKYYTNLEQVHRFDSLNLTRVSEDVYTANFTLAFLSEQGADGAAAAVVQEAVSEAAAQ